MIPGRFAKPRHLLPWLPYPESDRVIINSHNFLTIPPSIGFGDELLIWRGPTGTVDQSGNGNNGTYNGGMGVVSDTGSGGSQAFQFDGVNDFISIASPVVSATPLTLAAWVKANSVSVLGSIVCISTSAGTNHYWLLRHFATGNIGARSRAGGTGAEGLLSGLTTGWHLCIGEFLSSTSRTARRDTSSGTTSTTSRAPTGMNTLTVGYGYGADNGYFAGCIDDIRVFDRVLTSGEISAWAAAGRGYNV